MIDNGNRPRRLRRNAIVRDLVHETDLQISNLVQPYFLSAEKKAKEPIKGFDGVYRWGVELLSKKIEADLENGLKNILLFGAANSEQKNEAGSAAYEEKGLLPSTIRTLKERFSDSVVLISDVCLCPYTSHGHCGLVEGNEIENDSSLVVLGQMALAHAKSGVDIVAPSDMMDFRVGYIRHLLDEQGYDQTAIMAYTAKYSSSYYGPFREALGSAPKGTDRATYQMDFRNRTEALRELELDLAEGADMVMVKPALAYLDIIRTFKERSTVPVVAYSVSAEYQMVKLMAAQGLVDERKMALENLTAIRRAGADILITYFAEFIASEGWLK
jgi:porphobilinogen synthase